MPKLSKNKIREQTPNSEHYNEVSDCCGVRMHFEQGRDETYKSEWWLVCKKCNQVCVPRKK